MDGVQRLDLDEDNRIVEAEDRNLGPISAADRSCAREMLIPVYMAAAAFEGLRKPLGVCVQTIAKEDYGSMPNFLPEIVARLNLESQPLAEVVSALLLLREVSHVFEEESRHEHALHHFLETVVPPILVVGVAALEAPPEHLISSLVSKVICKILWSITTLPFDLGYGLPSLLARKSVAEPLMDYLLKVYKRKLPPDMDSASEDNAKIFWGVYKWSLRLWMRLLGRYSTPHAFPSATGTDFSAGEYSDVLSSRALHRLVMGKACLPTALQQTLVRLDATFQGQVLPKP